MNQKNILDAIKKHLGETTIERGQFDHLLTKLSVAWEGLPR